MAVLTNISDLNSKSKKSLDKISSKTWLIRFWEDLLVNTVLISVSILRHDGSIEQSIGPESKKKKKSGTEKNHLIK